jgi:hypothetical protein
MKIKTGVWVLAAAYVAEAVRSNGPIVDLGYAIYRGYHNKTSGLHIWKR